MRAVSLLCCLLVAGLAVVSAAPANVCSPELVQLELRPLGIASARTPTGILSDYQLAFVSVDPKAHQSKADFIDIHYRVNNEDSVNLRVLTEAAITDSNERAKQAQVDGIQLEGGDVIRAYATYSSNGIACDTPIHTFSAPHLAELEQMSMRPQQSRMSTNALLPPQRSIRREVQPRMSAEDRFWTQQAVDAEANTMAGACPGIAMDQDVLRQAGTSDSYVLSFENKTPARQLHYVDLHLSTDGVEWDNLRLASDMQLSLAHKVMQPGVVIRPNEQLAWYWSYRTSTADGSFVDCTTDVATIHPAEVTHEVNLQQLSIQ